MKPLLRTHMLAQIKDPNLLRLQCDRARSVILGALAVAVCCMVSGCPPVPSQTEDAPSETAQVRVATFNTRCIVPEMDDLSVWTQIINATEKGATFCNGTLAEIAGDILSVGGLTDTRGESRDRTRERAAAIADLIKKQQGDFDIIALNEVFLEDAREIFVDELNPIFPYYVDKLEGGTICTEDSGLMLFSRWPIEKLGDAAGGNSFPYFAGWTEYGDCRCEDCLAEKGAGYVRVQNPSTGDVYHVVFTHMQADSEVCPPNIGTTPTLSYAAIRSYQLVDIAGLLESWIGKKAEDWPAKTHVVFLGDLNVVGTQEKAAAAAKLDMPDNSEWHAEFDPAQSAGYFAGNLFNPDADRPLYDAWAQTTSPWDPGITSGNRKRFDYIFLNCVPQGQVVLGSTAATVRPLVPHHITLLPFNDESDHYGVHAVLNRWQPHCMPVEAHTPQAGYTAPDGSWSGGPNEITLGPWPNNQSYDMEITVPGGYQWFRFDQPGTYSFSLANLPNLTEQNETGDFEMRVYTATDLTNDVANYYGEETDVTEYFPPPGAILDVPAVTVIAKKFLIPEAPFYVRVSPKDPLGTGQYKLYAHRHEGRTKKDAVLLPVCCTQEYFHGLALLNAEDMPWFQVNLERPDNPASHQNLRFLVMWQPAGLTGTWLLRLQDENDAVLAQSVETKVSSPTVNDNDPAYGEVLSWHYVELPHSSLESLSSVANPRFYLRVARPGMMINGSFTTPYDRYRLRWETNLTILHGKVWAGTHALRLKCSDETCIDAADSDEAGMQIWADGMLLYDWTHNDIGGNATDMDSGDDVSLEKIVRPDKSLVRYVESCEFRVLEYDNGGPDYGSKKTLTPLEPRKNKAWKGSWGGLSVPCSGVGDDGSYGFTYNRSRSMQYPPCD